MGHAGLAAARRPGEALSRRSRCLCAFYGLIALVALAATWGQNIAYFQGVPGLGDIAPAFGAFLADTRINPASRSITVDIALFTLAGSTFMILEARRLGIRFVWAYILLGFLVAISVTFPLFMIARERHLCWCEGQAGQDADALAARDGLGIAVVVAVVAGLSAYILRG